VCVCVPLSSHSYKEQRWGSHRARQREAGRLLKYEYGTPNPSHGPVINIGVHLHETREQQVEQLCLNPWCGPTGDQMTSVMVVPSVCAVHHSL